MSWPACPDGQTHQAAPGPPFSRSGEPLRSRGVSMLADNGAFWRRSVGIFGPGVALVVFGAAFWVLTGLVVGLRAVGPLHRPDAGFPSA